MDHRKVDSADIERCKAIRLAALADTPDAFASTLEEELNLPTREWRERLANPNAVTFVAVVGGTDAGLVVGLPHWNQPDLAAIVSMWVAPKYRQAGVGTALIQEAIAWAKESGYAAAQLEVATTGTSPQRNFTNGWPLFPPGTYQRCLRRWSTLQNTSSFFDFCRPSGSGVLPVPTSA